MESPGEAKDREEGTVYLEKEIKETSTEDGVVGAEDEDDSMASSEVGKYSTEPTELQLNPDIVPFYNAQYPTSSQYNITKGPVLNNTKRDGVEEINPGKMGIHYSGTRKPKRNKGRGRKKARAKPGRAAKRGVKKGSSKKAGKAGYKEVPPLDPNGNNLITGDMGKGGSGPMTSKNRDGEWGGGYVAV